MSHLRSPLTQHLTDALDEAGIHRMWRGVGERRRRLPAERRRRWSYVAAAVAVAAALLVLWPRFLFPQEALTLAGGAPITVLEASTPKVEIVRLSDGSELRLHPGAKLTALESDGARFTTKLDRGLVDFVVKPGGPRRWSVECGLATVEVVGTTFSVERRLDEVEIRVREGTVLVRGSAVADGVVRLTVGQSLTVSAMAARVAPPGDGSTEVPGPATGPPMRSIDPAPVEAPDWQALANRGKHEAAYDALGPQGIAGAMRGAGPGELMRLADVARLSGHPAEAALPLRRIVEDHPGDGQAALAAFTLGKLELTSLGRPDAAAASFQRSISMGLAPGLLEDAHLRLVEAHVRAGNRPAAQQAADAYAKRFPNGRRRAAMDALLEPE